MDEPIDLSAALLPFLLFLPSYLLPLYHLPSACRAQLQRSLAICSNAGCKKWEEVFSPS
jgi:hypothetical protein